mmetsp:Transcript_9572/g.22349  ORF Transcript_9572/g.22349 Transcript_9572/m.22349 type:complete len:934 (+) Transcript_9572:1970-4771(+)
MEDSDEGEREGEGETRVFGRTFGEAGAASGACSLPSAQTRKAIAEELAAGAAARASACSHGSLSAHDLAPLLAVVSPFLALAQLRALLAAGRPRGFDTDAWAAMEASVEVKAKVDALRETFGGVTCVPQAWQVAAYVGAAVRLSGATRRMETAVQSPPPSPPTSPATRRARRRASADCGPVPDSSSLPKGTAQAPPDISLPESSARTLLSVAARLHQTWGSSLLGPAEVALLLRAGLSSAWQGRVVQLNQRLLLEVVLGATRPFAVAALWELGGGSVRQLAGGVFALLETEQEAFEVMHRLDLPAALSQATGIQMPRRADFMEGGTLREASYYDEVARAAELLTRAAAPWGALKARLQLAYRRGFGGMPDDAEGSPPLAGLRAGPPDLSNGMLTSPCVLSPSRESLAACLVETADSLGMRCVSSWSRHDGGWPEKRANASDAYLHAASAVGNLLRERPAALGAPWARAFFARHVEALTVLSIVRAVQSGSDGGGSARWLASAIANATPSGVPLPYGAAALAHYAAEARANVKPAASESSTSTLLSRLAKGALGNTPKNGNSNQLKLSPVLPAAPVSSAREQSLLEAVVRALYYDGELQEATLADPLVRLLVDPPPPKAVRWDLTLISAMGVITEGANGDELEATYARLSADRGVIVMRADTGSVRGLEYNSERIISCVRKVQTAGWAWVGYSQGCTNCYYAEHVLATGPPADANLLRSLRCRQLLFSAANGSAHSTCGEAKIRRAITAAEHALKRHQAHFSPQAIKAFLRALQASFESRSAVNAFGGLNSLSIDGVAAALWTGAAHKRWVPTGALRGIVEAHTLPEALQQIANTLSAQIESAAHDTQIAADTALAYPVSVANANSAMLAQCALPNRVQRTHHWSPLDAATDFVSTPSDRARAVYECPKDRHVLPFLEAAARFGLVDVLPGERE